MPCGAGTLRISLASTPRARASAQVMWIRWLGFRCMSEVLKEGQGLVPEVPMWLCGVQMVAMNYQTSDTGLLLNEGALHCPRPSNPY